MKNISTPNLVKSTEQNSMSKTKIYVWLFYKKNYFKMGNNFQKKNKSRKLDAKLKMRNILNKLYGYNFCTGKNDVWFLFSGVHIICCWSINSQRVLAGWNWLIERHTHTHSKWVLFFCILNSWTYIHDIRNASTQHSYSKSILGNVCET